MYEFMHVCKNVCIFYVCWYAACMCVRLANDFINVNTETKQLICFEEIIRPIYFLPASQIFTEATNFTEAVASFASYVAAALPVNSVSVTTPAKKTMYHLWNLGAKSFLFRDLGAQPPQPLCRTATAWSNRNFQFPPGLSLIKVNSAIIYPDSSDVTRSYGFSGDK